MGGRLNQGTFRKLQSYRGMIVCLSLKKDSFIKVPAPTKLTAQHVDDEDANDDEKTDDGD